MHGTNAGGDGETAVQSDPVSGPSPARRSVRDMMFSCMSESKRNKEERNKSLP